jgi:hypothetical protein
MQTVALVPSTRRCLLLLFSRALLSLRDEHRRLDFDDIAQNRKGEHTSKKFESDSMPGEN